MLSSQIEARRLDEVLGLDCQVGKLIGPSEGSSRAVRSLANRSLASGYGMLMGWGRLRVGAWILNEDMGQVHGQRWRIVVDRDRIGQLEIFLV